MFNTGSNKIMPGVIKMMTSTFQHKPSVTQKFVHQPEVGITHIKLIEVKAVTRDENLSITSMTLTAL
jgi:hypothetical protein